MAIEIETAKGKMRLAHDIQAGLFPSQPIQNQHAACVGVCQAAEDASGDYFDFIEESDGKIVLMIGDVSGHGVGPALLMAETRAYVRALLHSERHLVTILRQVNRFLIEDIDDGHFVTFMICRFDAGSGTIEYVGAGHEGLIIHRDGKSMKLESSTIPLGMCQTMPGCTSKSIDVQSNNVVALYTDGLIESRSVNGEMFGYQRLKKSFYARRHLPAASLIEQVFEDVEVFCGATPLRDDRTAVVLKLK
jgi:sigma-B regulation protein RsbU (phosphoserine phosphatase)